jgi:uncharacterized protein YciW
MLRDFRAAPLPEREAALLDFIETLSVAPFEIDDAAWARLRAFGWSDREVARAAIGASIFNYFNRMADGLGIRLDYPVSGEHQGGEPPPRPGAGPRHERASARQPELLASSPPGNEGLLEGLGEADAPELIAALAFIPAAARIVHEWRRYLLSGTPALSDALRARIALYSAGLTYCPASVRWARARAAQVGVAMTPALDEIARGTPDARDTREAFVFEHTRRLALEPWTAEEQHVVRLRDLGFTDRDIVQLTMLVSYLSFEHRVALALGIRS